MRRRRTGALSAALAAAVAVLGFVVPASPAAAAAPDPPRALPQNATANDLKWQPSLDFDTDGCYNVPAIGPDGTIAQGLPHDNTTGPADCHDKSDLDNTNVYSRQRCNDNGWCVYLYDYYFEKDVGVENVVDAGGHVNDWEHIAVWVQNDQRKFVSASQHGKYEVKAADDVLWEDTTHPKMVYHKDESALTISSTHNFRFANAADDPPENYYHLWQRGTLVSYNGFPGTLRDQLFAHSFGSASIAIKDPSFASNLEAAIPTTSELICEPNGVGGQICHYEYTPKFTFNYSADANGSPGDPNPPVTNPYPSDAKTFTINGGSTGTSFVTTQPRNSVATYTWTDGQAPQEWLTSADGNTLGRKLQPTKVSSWGASSTTISVDPGQTHQTIDGFGGAMTDSAASLILGSPDRDAIMRTLFGTGDGQAGLTLVRSPMGSSDLMADGNDFHTYEDTRGSFSAESTASDKRQIDALQRAKAVAGDSFKLIGTPWSAPGWAKRGGTLRASECGTEGNELNVNAVSDYAGYFKKYVDAYSAKGIRPWMVSMQNEPENCKTAMPTTLMSPGDEVALATSLKQQLPADVKVMGWDHNWNDKDFVNTLTNTGKVDAIGYHCYDGTHYATQTQAVPTYMTECSGFGSTIVNVATNLGWEVGNMLMGPLRYGSRGSIYWSLALDQNGGPHLSGTDACSDCRGMIAMHNDGHFEPSQDFYYYAHFSKFVRPGAVRIESSNSDEISTVAFRDGNRTTLVVLISGTRVDGGYAGSDERDLHGHILQYSGENAAQKTSWLVGADGYRRWISDIPTYSCLKDDAGMQGPDNVAGGALDKYINIKDVWAVCGAVTMGTRSELEVGTYLKTAGGARLTLTKDGLRSVDATGKARWAPSGTGDRLILQDDQNLVLYSGNQAVWASNTKNSGAIWLSLRDDGTFALFNKDNQKVWVSTIDASSYRHSIVQWDGDTATQKTSWMVGNDGNRRWIPDQATFQCLHDAGAGNSISLSSDVLDKLPDLTNVWATCGADRIGANGAIEENSYLKAGDYRLTLTSGDLVITKNGAKVWSSGHGGAQLKLQTDGNLVEYDSGGHATWATGTSGKSAGWLVLGNDGSLRLYDAGGTQVWTR